MNKMAYSKPAQTAPSTDACLSDDQLRELLGDLQTQPQQATLIAHLDQCDSCRRRLEAAAADQQHWTAVRHGLQAVDTEESQESARLTAAIVSLCTPTETDLNGSNRQPDEAADAPAGTGEQAATGELATVAIPASIGPYRIVEQVGRGGMGVVYKAFDPALRRHVAIKRIADSLLAQPGASEGFRREARAAAAVHDPHVVSIHAIEDSEPEPYLVMEFVAGRSLAEWLDHNGRLDWQMVAKVGAEAATGLAAAHAAGVIHRDVKPANILIEEATGRVKIGDFGLARMLDEPGHTRSGLVRGTPEYISPEQAAGDPVDYRADLFSLGSVLYTACTGQPPFQADNAMAVLRRTREESHQAVVEFRGDVPQPLSDLIDRLLSKSPDDRFATAQEVADVLSRIHRGEDVRVAMPTRRTASYSPIGGLMRIVALLALAVGIGAGGIYAGAALLQEDNGQPDSTLAAANGPNAPKKAKKSKKSKKTRSKEPAAAVETDHVAPALPTRVQIVRPDDLMRERIRAEKDQLEQRRHPLLVREFTGHTGPVNSIAITADTELLISASGWPTGDRSVRVWDIATGKELRQFDAAAMPKNHGASGPREAPGEFHTVAVTPDGQHAVTGTTGGAVCVWSVATGKLVRQFEEHTATVYDSAISSGGDVVLTGGRGGIGRLWDLRTGDELMRLTGHRSWVRCVAISPDGKRALTGSYDKVVRLWDLERAELIREFQTPKNWIWDVAFAPSGTLAAFVSGRTVQLWDLDSGKVIRTLPMGDSGTSVDISADGRLVIGGSYNGEVRLWDLDSGELLETFTGHRDWVWTVKFSPDGRHALSAGGGRNTATSGYASGVDCTIRQWKLPTVGPRVARPR